MYSHIIDSNHKYIMSNITIMCVRMCVYIYICIYTYTCLYYIIVYYIILYHINIYYVILCYTSWLLGRAAGPGRRTHGSRVECPRPPKQSLSLSLSIDLSLSIYIYTYI